MPPVVWDETAVQQQAWILFYKGVMLILVALVTSNVAGVLLGRRLDTPLRMEHDKVKCAVFG